MIQLYYMTTRPFGDVLPARAAACRPSITGTPSYCRLFPAFFAAFFTFTGSIAASRCLASLAPIPLTANTAALVLSRSFNMPDLLSHNVTALEETPTNLARSPCDSPSRFRRLLIPLPEIQPLSAVSGTGAGWAAWHLVTMA